MLRDLGKQHIVTLMMKSLVDVTKLKWKLCNSFHNLNSSSWFVNWSWSIKFLVKFLSIKLAVPSLNHLSCIIFCKYKMLSQSRQLLNATLQRLVYSVCFMTSLCTAGTKVRSECGRTNPCLVKVIKDVCGQGCFTFKSFLVKDDCVVLWCLRQTEKLTSETRKEMQMKRGM